MSQKQIIAKSEVWIEAAFCKPGNYVGHWALQNRCCWRRCPSVSKWNECQDWDTRVELAEVVLQGVVEWRSTGGSLWRQPDPLLNQEVYGGSDRPAVGI